MVVLARAQMCWKLIDGNARLCVSLSVPEQRGGRDAEEMLVQLRSCRNYPVRWSQAIEAMGFAPRVAEKKDKRNPTISRGLRIEVCNHVLVSVSTLAHRRLGLEYHPDPQTVTK